MARPPCTQTVSLAAGTIAAGGTLGILIPPSNALIIYGLLTETDVGKLFIAGIIPGINPALIRMKGLPAAATHG